MYVQHIIKNSVTVCLSLLFLRHYTNGNDELDLIVEVAGVWRVGNDILNGHIDHGIVRFAEDNGSRRLIF